MFVGAREQRNAACVRQLVPTYYAGVRGIEPAFGWSFRPDGLNGALVKNLKCWVYRRDLLFSEACLPVGS